MDLDPKFIKKKQEVLKEMSKIKTIEEFWKIHDALEEEVVMTPVQQHLFSEDDWDWDLTSQD